VSAFRPLDSKETTAMPDAPFSNIDPWTRTPREATIRSRDDGIRHLAAELLRLRQELQAARETVKDSADESD
jgi:hypothetical protein